MEDVLEVYTRPRDPQRSVDCLDETSKQLIAKTRVPGLRAGRPARLDSEYVRNGTANLFMIYAPLEGWRHVKVTDRRAAIDYPGAEGPRRHSLSRRRQNCAGAKQSDTLVPPRSTRSFPPPRRAKWHSTPKGHPLHRHYLDTLLAAPITHRHQLNCGNLIPFAGWANL